MSKNTRKELIIVALILLLLYLLLRKKTTVQAATSVTINDPITGIPIGASGVQTNSIGSVLLPNGIPNNIEDSSFQAYAQNPNMPLCPNGYSPVIDPSNNQVYCVLPIFTEQNNYT